MTVYVDNLVQWPTKIRCFKGGSCHLEADTLEELHAFAAKLGLRRSCSKSISWATTTISRLRSERWRSSSELSSRRALRRRDVEERIRSIRIMGSRYENQRRRPSGARHRDSASC